MHRGAMHRREARGNLDRPDRVLRLERPHRNVERTGERLGRCASDIGPIHRDIRTAGDVPQFDPILDQRLLERKRAAQGKADKIVTPDVEKVGRLLDELTAAPHPITWQITADVEILTQTRQAPVTGSGDPQYPAGV